MHRARIAAGRNPETLRKRMRPDFGGYLPMVSVTPPVHQKPGRRIPPMSQ